MKEGSQPVGILSRTITTGISSGKHLEKTLIGHAIDYDVSRGLFTNKYVVYCEPGKLFALKEFFSREYKE